MLTAHARPRQGLDSDAALQPGRGRERRRRSATSALAGGVRASIGAVEIATGVSRVLGGSDGSGIIADGIQGISDMF